VTRRVAVLFLLQLQCLVGLQACDEAAPAAPKTVPEQCRALLGVIAEHEERGGKSDSLEPAALMKSAAAVEKAGATVADLELPDPKLTELRRRYANMARDLGLTSRDFAKARAEADREAETRAGARLSTSRAVERNLRAELAAYCAVE
jgi:hypothetical protein